MKANNELISVSWMVIGGEYAEPPAPRDGERLKEYLERVDAPRGSVIRLHTVTSFSRGRHLYFHQGGRPGQLGAIRVGCGWERVPKWWLETNNKLPEREHPVRRLLRLAGQ